MSSDNFTEYKITNEKLGKGTSHVYRAVNLKTKENLACKIVIKNELGANGLENLKTEIKILKKLLLAPHKNIVGLQAYLDNPEKCYLLFEYIEGSDLCAFMSAHRDSYNKGLTEKDAHYYFCQLLDAVEHLHKHGIMHRDIKLDNIMLDSKTDQVKLVDFGLSGFLDEHEYYDKYCGSLNYAAPELISHTHYKGAPVDIWSLGVTLYTLLECRFPFDTDFGLDDLFKIVLNNDVSFYSKVSSEAQALIMSMLDKDPTTRITIQEIRKSKWFGKF